MSFVMLIESMLGNKLEVECDNHGSCHCEVNNIGKSDNINHRIVRIDIFL